MMFAFEVEGNSPYDEHPVTNGNFVDNPLYNHDPWSSNANPSFGEQLLPQVQPKILMAAADRGEQYINLFAQPPIQNRPQSARGKKFIPMNSAYT